MRVKSHIDKLKRQTSLSEEEMDKIEDMSSQVGWAAGVLCDPYAKIDYGFTI